MFLTTAQRIAGAHPAAILAPFFFGPLAQFAIPDALQPPLVRGILLALPIACICGWLWAVYTLSNQVAQNPKPRFWGGVYVIPPVVALAAGVGGWATHNSPAAFAIFVALFLGLTFAAKTLEKVDAPDGNPSVGRMLGTAILMYIAFIGIWVLRPKILRVAQRAQGAPAAI